MPEMHFRVQWPSGLTEDCYSPSWVIEQHLVVGEEYSVSDFVERVSAALHAASDRVALKYGVACSSALDQLAAIRATAASLSPEERAGMLRVLAFEKHAPRDARASNGRRAGTSNRRDDGASGREAGGAARSTRSTQTASHHTVVVIGGGQAGLSVSYCLKEQGIEHVVLERHRIANSWRTERWDTFCLVTPNWQCQLPGFSYQGPDPKGFMVKDDIVSYLEDYAASFHPPVAEGVEVRSLRRIEDAGQADAAPRFELETSIGTMTADHVVVAIGGYHVRRVPAMGQELPAHVVQLHSSQYRNPDSLPPGDVLVVGTGQSGAQIAEDLHVAGRKVHLCVGNAPRCARRYRGKDVVEWLDRMGYYDLPIDQHPNKEQVRDKTNHYVTGRDGGRDIDLRQFAREGMRLYGPLQSIADGKLRFAPTLKENLDAADAVYRNINRTIDKYIEKEQVDAPCDPDYAPVWEPEAEIESLDFGTSNISAVVWCAGFHSDFGWVKVPIFDERGYPRHERGITEVRGLYFIGLPWLYTWGSGRFSGVARDARHVVADITAKMERGDVQTLDQQCAVG